MISQLREQVAKNGNATIDVDQYNQLQNEWILRVGAQDLIKAERFLCAKMCDDKSHELASRLTSSMDENEVSDIKSRAWEFMVMAATIRLSK